VVGKLWPKNNKIIFAQYTSKHVLLSSESDDVFVDSLALSGRDLWPIITSKAMIVAVVSVKGF